jgi:putative inorganic carbon (hco3(-)) transporter
LYRSFSDNRSTIHPSMAAETWGWVELLWLITLTPFILLPGRLVDAEWHPYMVAALFAGWPLRLLLYRRLSIRTPLDWSLGAMLLWLPVTYILAVNKDEAWIALGYLLLGVALYFAVINWPPLRKRPDILTWGFAAMGAVLTVLGFGLLPASYIKRIDFLSELHSQISPMVTWLGESVNPNILAGSLVLAVPMVLALAIGREARPGWQRTGLMLSMLVMIVMIVAVNSRGAMGAIGLSTLLVLALRWSRFWPWMVALLVPVSGMLFWVGPGRLLTMVAENDAVGGLDVRLSIFDLSFRALQSFNLYGIGIGMYPYVMPALFPGAEHAGAASQPHAHNLLLQIGLDLGVPGLVAYLVMILTVIVLLIRVWHRASVLQHRTLAIGALGALAAMFAHGVVDAVTWGVKSAFLPWLIYALAVLLDRNLKRRTVRKRKS